jgi:hypothetical protein
MEMSIQAKAATERSAAAAQAEAEELKQQLAELQAAPSGEGVDSAVTRLLQLIYFAMVNSPPASTGLNVLFQERLQPLLCKPANS